MRISMGRVSMRPARYLPHVFFFYLSFGVVATCHLYRRLQPNLRCPLCLCPLCLAVPPPPGLLPYPELVAPPPLPSAPILSLSCVTSNLASDACYAPLPPMQLHPLQSRLSDPMPPPSHRTARPPLAPPPRSTEILRCRLQSTSASESVSH
jgi:hypothetical protein